MRQGRLLTFLFLFISLSNSIQSQDYASDWTAEDLNGVTHHFQDYIDDGKHVIIDFSATWCPPCWTYHQSGTLETMWDLYGPDGTDEIMIFYLESDFDTNLNCLYGSTGCNDSSMGDWVTGTPYPIVHLTASNGGAVWTQYGLSAFPTVSVISAHTQEYYNLVGNGASTQSILESWIFDSFEMEVAGATVDELCGEDGQVSVNVSNGSGSLYYSWSNGAGNISTLDNVSAGSYTVTVSDANGYELSETFTIDGNSVPSMEFTNQSIQDVNCFGETNGVISIEVSGGLGSLTYVWDNGMTGSEIEGLSSGIYNVIISDEQGCEILEQFEVEEPSELSVESFPSNESCDQANGEIHINTNGGSLPYTITLNGEENSSGLFTSLEAGVYDVVVEDNNGCMYFEQVELTNSPTPTAVANVTGFLNCNNPEIEIDGVGSTEGDVTYEWSTFGGAIVGSSNGLYATVSAPGVYTLYIVDNVSGCDASTEVTVEGDIESASLNIDQPMSLDCSTSQITLEASSSISGTNMEFEWSTTDGNIVSGGSTLSAVVDAEGTYTLLATNISNGCISEIATTVTEDSSVPTVSTTSGTLTCSITSTDLCAEVSVAGSTAMWSYNGTTTEGLCISATEAGVYTVMVTAPNGCTTTAEHTVEQSDELPQITLSEPAALTCSVSSVTITGTIEGDISNYTFQWTDEMGVVLGTELSITVAAGGVYQLSVMDNTSGCSSASMTTVEVSDELPELAIEQPESLTCTVSSVIITGQVSGDISNLSFQWTNEMGDVIGTELSTTVTSGGSYELAVTNNLTGCSSSSMTTVEESDDLPQISVLTPAELTCQVTTITLTVEVMGDPANYNFTWGDDEEAMIGMMQMVMVTEPGEYSITVEEKGTGCTSVQTIMVTEVRNDPVSNYEVENDNGTLNLGSTSMGSPTSMVWTANGVEISDISNLTFDANGTYEICLTVTNDCGTDTKCADYNYVVALETADLKSDITCNAQADGSIELNPSGGEGNYSVVWTGPNGYESTDLNISGLEAGDYSMTLSDSYGYEITESYSITEPSAIGQGSTIMSNETSAGASDGSISFSAFGGTGELSYLWSNGDTGATLSGVPAGDYTVEVSDENGCTELFGPFTIQLMTGVEDISFASAFSIYPNPTTDMLFVDIEFVKTVTVKVNITDAFGRLIESSNVSGNGALNYGVDVTSYDSGIYFLEITDGVESTTEKFMVIK